MVECSNWQSKGVRFDFCQEYMVYVTSTDKLIRLCSLTGFKISLVSYSFVSLISDSLPYSREHGNVSAINVAIAT